MTNEQARQNLIANNLANAETNGFRRQMALFQERPPEPAADHGDRGGTLDLANVTGGRWMLPTKMDTTQGGLEQTGNPARRRRRRRGLPPPRAGGASPTSPATARWPWTRAARSCSPATRRARCSARTAGPSCSRAAPPARFTSTTAARSASATATPSWRRSPWSPPTTSARSAATASPTPARPRPAPDTQVRGGFLETSNVEPTTELTRLIESGRLLEANAKMITFQDQSLGKLLEAGAIG